jgi:hypothetical protein
MKTATGLTVLAIGTILLFAVHGHPGFLNFQVVGLVLVACALGSLSTRLRPGWPARQAQRLQTWLTAETGEVDGARVPLEDILQEPAVQVPSPRVAPDGQPTDSGPSDIRPSDIRPSDRHPSDSHPSGSRLSTSWPGNSSPSDDWASEARSARDNVTVPGR